MTRQVTPFVRGKIEQWEELRLVAYWDAIGHVWTIGYGHTGSDVHDGLTITEEQADTLLLGDLASAEDIVSAAVTVPLTDNQFGALVSFVFNVGPGGKAPGDGFLTSTLLKKLNSGDYDAVPVELAKWNHAGGKVVRGLTNRRAAEIGLWSTGAPVASNTVPAAPAQAPLLNLKNVAAGAASVIPLATTIASNPGPLQWALAAIGVAAAGVCGWLVLREHKAAGA